jgi:DNA-binding transcriptional MerR regulator
MARQRISLAKDLRIKELRRQGYNLEHIAALVNVRSVSSIAQSLRRSSQHWKVADDPWLGRQRNHLSNQQLEEIIARRNSGETLHSIGQSYSICLESVRRICLGLSYANDEEGYPFDLTHSRSRHLL